MTTKLSGLSVYRLSKPPIKDEAEIKKQLMDCSERWDEVAEFLDGEGLE